MGSSNIPLKNTSLSHMVIFLQIVGLTLIFYLTAHLGLFLAIPPGFATVIWLPSGLSLAFILLFGYRIAPAIWIGSCWVNFEMSHHFEIAFSIGFGSTLQALLGAYLVNRFVGFPNPLNNEREIISFLLLGGPISCLVAATWGCLTILFTNQIQPYNFLYNWCTWWAGDTMGVLVFTPLVLIWTAEPREIWQQRRLSLSIPLCIMFAIIVGFILYTNRAKEQKIQQIFKNQAQDYASALIAEINTPLEILSSLSIALNEAKEINSISFNIENMSQLFVTKYPSIRAISWLEPASRIENAVNIFPFLNSIEEKQKIIQPNAKLLNQACLAHQAIATSFNLSQKKNDWGLLIFQPVYDKNVQKSKIEPLGQKGSSVPDCQNLLGYLVGFIEVNKLIANTKNLHHQSLGLNLYETNEEGKTKLIYSSAQKQSAPILTWNDTIYIADRKWQLQIIPRKGYFNALRGWEEWAAPIGSVLLIGLLGSLLLIVTGRTAMIEAIVALRTSELQISNQNLLKEIAERKAIENALAFHAKELARTNAELEQFAYITSHDLQEPLRIIVSYLQLLERRYRHELDANAMQFIHFAIESAIRLQNLIKDLLNYSQLGKKSSNLSAINSEQILEQVLRSLRIAIEENEAVITYDPLPDVIAESTQLTQLFQNLISNAIKFKRNSPILIHISAQLKKDSWIFSIQDNGIGIDPENFNRIFILFQHLHNRGDYPGTGIGLAICKKIVEHLGGKIWVTSQLDKGSTFYFSLPVTPLKAKVSS